MLAVFLAACSSTAAVPPALDAANQSGGNGGSVTGGASVIGAGGSGGTIVAVGGAVGSGGSSASGGAAGPSGGTVGGSVSNGGTTSSGGSVATGGALGGAVGAGGTMTGGVGGKASGTGSGGAGAGGTIAAGGAGTGCPMELVGWATVSGDGLDGTTGGGNASPQRVTTLSELRTLAGDATARVIQIFGTIDVGTTAVDISSNKTVVGVDKNATIKGGINIRAGNSNIIVRNLTIQGKGQGNDPVDTAAARTSHHLWFDHLSIGDASDGNLDLTIGSNYLTVSWSKFWYTDPNHTHRLSCLVGAGSTAASTDTGKNNVTYHHNWFAELVDQRMPRVLFGKGHVFNNYYTSTGNTYCVGSGSFASILVENNYFKNVKSPHRFQDSNPSYITAVGNVYDNTTGNKDTGLGGASGTAVAPFTDPPYDYTADKAADVPSIASRCVGPQ
jgi:pectate lyase